MTAALVACFIIGFCAGVIATILAACWAMSKCLP